MKTGLMLQLVLLVTLLAGSSEQFFFQFPKKALTEFFQSLRARKQPPKTQHYHVHYYPIPFPMLAWKAPDKYDLEALYDDSIRTFGWSDYHYRYAPDPALMLSMGLQHLWDGSESWDDEILAPDDPLTSIDRNAKGVLVQVPLNQQLVFHLLKRSRQKQAAT